MKQHTQLAVLCLIFLAQSPGFADPWPAEDWNDAANISDFDSASGADLSGAAWNPVSETLWVCRNGPGGTASKFWVIADDGTGDYGVQYKGGNRGEWTGLGDAEGITFVNYSEEIVYLIIEGEERINSYDVSVYGTLTQIRDWDASAYLPKSGGLGAEGITFVPDNWLEFAGFSDAAGNPYTSQNGMGGLMFIGHQNGGRIYVFDLAPDSDTFTFVGAYRTSYSETAGLEFDRSTGLLYIWHGDANDLEVTSLDSYIENGERRLTPRGYFDLPGNANIEGIALPPATNDLKFLYLTRDGGGEDALRWFDEFDPGISYTGPDREPPTVTVGSPAAPPLFFVPVNVIDIAGLASDNHCIIDVTYDVRGATTASGTADTNTFFLVAADASWRYLDTGADPDAGWHASAFDDQAWLSGNAELGYGEGDEATVLGGEPATAYFRHTFGVTRPDILADGLRLRVRRDDGVVIYLNEHTIMSDNMPVVFSHATWASTNAPDDGDEWIEATIPVGYLVNGPNIIAAEVHQWHPQTSDLTFALELLPGAARAWAIPTLTLNAGTSRVDIVARDAAGNAATNGIDIIYVPDNTPPTVSIDNAPGGRIVATSATMTLSGGLTDNFGIDRVTVSGSAAGAGTADLTYAALLESGDSWSYLDDGSAPSSTWMQVAFNSFGWPSGASQFGYGEGDEATVIDYGPDPTNKHPTVYFRHPRVISDLSAYSGNFKLRIKHDDGVIIYVNGTAVLIDNLTAPFTAGAWAPVSIADDGQTWRDVIVDRALLQTGENMIAAEVHQSYPETSDMSFDAELYSGVPHVWRFPLILNEGTNLVKVIAADLAGHAATTSVSVIWDADTDDDDLEDAWEMLHWGSLAVTSGGPQDDQDDDGFLDRNEHGAGSDPLDPASYLGISTLQILSGDQIEIYWMSESNRVYNLLASTNIVAGFPITLATGILATPPLNQKIVSVAGLSHGLCLRIVLAP